VELEKQTYDEGTASFVAVITELDIKTASGKTTKKAAPFNVASPTHGHKFVIHAKDGAIEVAEH